MKLNRSSLLAHLCLIVAVALTIGPYLWMILTSLKPLEEAVRVPPSLLPEAPSLRAYHELFQALPFAGFFWNSFVYTAVSVSLQILFASMAAYVFARIDLPGGKLLFGLVLMITMVPWQIFLIPNYLLIARLHLLDSLSALILPTLFSAYGTFLLRQFFKNVPKELEDAAYLDGCTTFGVYFRVMLPLVRSGLMAFGIITMIWTWNSLLWPLIVNSSVSKQTISSGLAVLDGRAIKQYPMMMAGSFLGSLPMITMFFIFQKKVIEGITAGAVKG